MLSSNSSQKGVQNIANPPDFTFCNSSSIKNIVMLANHQTIVKKILKDTVKSVYFWIYEDTKTVGNTLQEMPEQIQKLSLIFSSILKMEEFLNEKNKNIFKKIVLVSSPQNKKDIKKLLRRQIFIGAIIYSDNSKEIFCQIEEKSNDNKNENSKIIECFSKDSFHFYLENNLQTYAEEQTFPTFVLLRKEVMKSTTLSRVLSAMTKQKMDPEVRHQIFSQLSKLLTTLGKFHQKIAISKEQLKIALKQLEGSRKSDKDIIRLYSSEKNQMYVLLNSFLRGLSCPTELYYIQPIVRDLFLAIQNLYCMEKKEDFVCYRGGFMSTEEFQLIGSAVGEVIQNLGFLSTSKNQEVAETFNYNVIFKIDVPSNSDEQIGFGFANISQFSEFFAEEEILFNPLNCFKVLEISEFHQTGESALSFFVFLQYITSTHREDIQDQQNSISKTLFTLNCELNKNYYNQSRVIMNIELQKQFFKAVLYFSFVQKKANQIFGDIIDLINQTPDNANLNEKLNIQFTSDQTSQLCQYLTICFTMGIKLTEVIKIKEGMQLLQYCRRINKLINYDNCEMQILKNSKFIQVFIEFALKIGQFEEVEYIIMKYPISNIPKELYHSLEILVLRHKFTKYYHKLVWYSKEGQTNQSTGGSQKQVQINEMALEKKLYEGNQAKKDKCWMSFIC